MEEEIMVKMEQIKKRLETVKTEKSRLDGEIAAKEQQLKELEEKCKEEFDCDLESLPGLLDGVLTKIKGSQAKIAEMLGIDG